MTSNRQHPQSSQVAMTLSTTLRVLIVAAACIAAIGVMALIVVLPPHLIDTRGLTPEQRLTAENALRGTLVTALAGIALALGTYVTARTFGHQRDVLAETTRHSRRLEEIQLRTLLAESKRESCVTFIKWFRELSKGSTNAAGQKMPSPEANELYLKWTEGNWAVDSDEIILEFQELIMQLLRGQDANAGIDAVPFRQFGRVMLALRRDAGNIDTTLDEGHALRYLLVPGDWHMVPQALNEPVD